MKGKFNLNEKFKKLTPDSCFISEITLAELKFGVANSDNPNKNKLVVENFLTGVQILPIFQSLDFFAEEKTRLRKLGTVIVDFDLLIASTAITHQLTMLTNNVKHFKRIKGIIIEDWTL
jgi:tRNA(fMet)-specific endonuclease VapC